MRSATRPCRLASSLLAITIAVFGAIGCTDQPAASGSDSTAAVPPDKAPEAMFREQLGRTWELARLGDQEFPANPPRTEAPVPGRHPGLGTRPTIRFTDDTATNMNGVPGMKAASGWSFCNGYGAAYRLGPGDQLRFQQFQSTLVGCDSPDAPESRYFTALGNTRRFAIDSATLTLIVDDTTRLTFVPSAAQPVTP